MSRNWLRHGYSKVARIFGKPDSKKQNFTVLEGHPAAQEHAEVAVETHGTIRTESVTSTKNSGSTDGTLTTPTANPFSNRSI
ncbi:hypothetical protein SLA2020_083250 [Shorea laevis]